MPINEDFFYQMTKQNQQATLFFGRNSRHIHTMSVTVCVVVLLASLLTLINNNVLAQPYYFRHYQVENGLSNNTVFCSVLDRNGFLWLGTKDGLDCFNGYTFKEYRSGDSAKDLKDSYIRHLYLDSSGPRDILYIGTRIGVFKFDPLSETFDFILHTEGEVNGITRDPAGRLWVISHKKVICFDPNASEPRNTQSIASLEATALCKTPDGQIWVASATGYLYKITYSPYNEPFHLQQYNLFARHPRANIKWVETIFAMQDGRVLIGTSNFGAKVFDPVTHEVNDLITYNSEHNGIFARDFKEIGDSVIWIATESGIYIYNLRSGQAQNLAQQTADPYSLSDNAVYSLTVDNEGGIWAGTHSGGLNYYAYPYSNFEKYYSAQGQNAISGNVVREITQDEYGGLWIGTEDGGLNRLDQRTGKIKHFLTTGRPTDISYPNIHALLSYGDTLLIGTFEHGLDMMDLSAEKIIQHYPKNADQNGQHQVLKSNFIISLCRTKEGNIYVGTRLGLYRFFPQKNRKGHHFEPVLPELQGAFIHTLMLDSKDRVWIGTMGSGLYCYTPETGAVEKFLHDPANISSIGNDWVTCTYEDSSGRIWVGTEGGGLCLQHADPDSLQVFKRYTVQNGMPANTIYKILEDNKGALWISTAKGLLRWDLTTDKKDVYTTANGLLSDQFNYNSGFKDPSGRLYFGCVKGMISFNPKDFTESDFIAPLYITSLQAEGQEIADWNDIQNNNLLAQRNRDNLPVYIEIPHRSSSLAIEFAALSYTAPEMIQYSYTLEGLDNGWTHLASNRKVYFTNLSPGDYIFRVKSTNVSGKWNDQETRLYIRILPTFWESNLAIAIYIIVVMGILTLLLRNYHARQKEKNKRLVEHMAYVKEKELYEAKIDFFTHVTHEIKTPLTLIKAPLEKITKQVDQYPAIQKYIRMIQRNAARLIALSEQLLDFRKAEVSGYQLHINKVDIRDVLGELQPDFKALAKEKNISFKMYLPQEPVYIEADKDALTKILSNLLDNGTKYAAGTLEARLQLLPDTGQVRFSTTNDGPVINEEDKHRIFDPFVRMETAQSSSGAGLGLSLCATLTKLHHGSLELETPQGAFNTFTLTLPVRQQTTESKNNRQ